METQASPPDIVFVRVRTPAGPYREGDVLTVAFSVPGIGRLAAHDLARAGVAPRSGTPIVPESFSADVVTGSGPYATGDRVTLSFVDPHVARIHPAERSARRLEIESPVVETPSPSVARELAVEALPGREGSDNLQRAFLPQRASPTRPGVRVRLAWTADRSRRFVAVCDKLFTVERLGWYRHALAMRLLVPDSIATGDDVSDLEASRHLQALRTAAADTLGRPLVAACMPNFSVTAEWLDGLEGAPALRAAGGLRDAILPFVDDDETVDASDVTANDTLGVVRREDVSTSSTANLDAFVPTLIPYRSTDPVLSEALVEYRRALADAFGQTADAVDAVRLNAMTQPNHALDDRLWRLVGAVGSFHVDPSV